MLRLALYQPDIPQNAGTMLRMCACLGVAADIIEPAGFPVSDRHFRRAGMDYLDQVAIRRHVSWTTFDTDRRAEGARLVLLTTRGAVAHTAFRFRRATFSWSGARAPAFRRRSMPRPMAGSSFRCARRCGR